MKTGTIIGLGIGLLLTAMVLLAGCSMLFGTDAEKVEVTSIKLKQSTLTVKAGSMEYLELNVLPENARDETSITWEWDPEVLTCTTDNYGVVIQGLKAGSSALVARCGKISSTCIVTVTGVNPTLEIAGADSYLYSSYNVLEMKPGLTQKISASLYGGTLADTTGFTWSIDKPEVAELNPAGQYCHVAAKGEGAAQITVTHTKTSHAYTILLYVYTDAMTVTYITTSQNIVNVYLSSGEKTITVDLMNAQHAQTNFTWEVLKDAEGSEKNIQLAANGASAVITPVQRGISTVRVSHPLASYPQDILIRVIEIVSTAFIEPDATVITVKGSAPQRVSAQVVGLSNASDAFTWKVANEEVVDTLAAGNQLLLMGKTNGATKITISHPEVAYDREIMVLVRDQTANAINASMYITTSQNYIQTKVGAEGMPLNISLVGGVPGDEAQFEWAVSDSSIIKLETTHGKVRSIFDSRSNGTAYITGLAEGTAVITVTHPKIVVPTEILVKVLPVTALLEDPFYLMSETIIGLVVGQQKNSTVILSGNGKNPSDEDTIIWNTENAAVVTVSGSGGSARITAVSAGEAYITVTHPKVEIPKKILVYTANSEEELMVKKLIYTTKSYHVLQTGKNVTLRLGYSNIQTSEFAGIQWSIDDPAVGYLSLGANNTEGVITGLKAGQAKVTAVHPLCAAPVVFTVTVVPAGTVITIDPETGEEVITANTNYITGESIIGIVVGKQKNTVVQLAGKDILPSDTGNLIWTTENALVAAVNGSGESGAIQAVSAGQTYITVSHAKAAVPKRILVYTANTEAELAAVKLIYTAKNYQVVTVGKTAKLVLGKNNLAVNELSGIQWSIDDTSIGSIALGMDAAECVVTGKKPGETKVTAQHPLCTAPVIFTITVVPAGTVVTTDPETGQEITPGGTSVNTNYLSGESIIGIVVGKQKNTVVQLSGKDIFPSDAGNIIWTTENALVAAVSGVGESGAIQAVSAGQTYITVSHAKVAVPKRILVYTANTEAELAAVKLLYTVKNRYTIVKGSKETLYLNYVNFGPDELSGINWQVSNGVIASITMGKNNSECVVKGLQEGSTAITASHTAAGISVIFTIDVVNSAAAAGVAAPPVYFTTAQNLVQFSAPGTNKEVTVTPVNLSVSDYHFIDWSVENTDVCTIVPNDAKAAITAKAPGETVIRVSHGRAENILKITVRVGAEYIYTNQEIAYISSSREVITLVAGSEESLIDAVLVNATEPSGFIFSIDQPGIASISTQFSTGKCFIKPVAAGQAELTIHHDRAAFDKKVVVVVGNRQEDLDGITYLSTAQNVVIIPVGSTKTVNVSVQGSKDAVISGYTWASSNAGVVQASSTGATAVLTGNGIGSATITVRQWDCLYPLDIIVMVVDAIAASAHPYITSSNTMYIVTVGQNWKTLEAELIGGSGGDDDDFLWNTPNTSLITLYGQGKTAMVKALSSGTAVVTISHPKAQYTRSIRIICEQAQAVNCYINVAESIMTLKPTDGAKNITASLINGAAEDKYNFTWFLDTFDVVELNYSANVASIRPLSQGQTTLHVTHPKSAYEQQIIIKVSEYTTFSFGKDSQTITAGTIAFLPMQIPVTAQSTHVEYTTNSAAVVTIAGTKAVAQITGAGEGTAIVTAKLVATVTNAVQATAEMLVYCKKAESTLTFINCTTTVYTLEKNLSRTISAAINGPDIIATDVNNLQWQSSDAAVVKISGASTTGVATGKQINVQAVGTGECTITISHDKSNSPLTLYCIVPGSGALTIALSKTYITLEAGKNTEIKAALTNGTPTDYTTIVWTLNQVDNVSLGTLLGSGQTVAVYAQKPGQTKLRAALPNGAFAECDVLIQASRQFSFNTQSIRLRPGAVLTVGYTLSPEDAEINYTTTNENYFTYTSSRSAKTITITGKSEGTATLTGVTNYGTKANLTIVCAWDYEFSLGKSAILSEPRADPGVPDKFVIPYTVSPANGTIGVSISNPAIASYTIDTANKKITIIPKGEGAGTVTVTAANPNDGNKVFGTKTCSLTFKYDSISLVTSLSARDGSFSAYSSSVNTLTLGDGETASLAFSVAEPNVSYQVEAVSFVKQDTASPVQVLSTSSNNTWQVKHPNDALAYEYLVTQDSWYEFKGIRLTINWKKYTDSLRSYSRSFISSDTVDLGSSGMFVAYYLVRGAVQSVPGEFIERDTPGVGWFVVENTLVGIFITNFTRVLTDITPRRVNEAVFKANTNWYIPPQEWTEGDQSGICAEYFINPATLVPVLDKTVASNVTSGYLKVTVLHNGVRQSFNIPVQVETRNCVYNQQ